MSLEDMKSLERGISKMVSDEVMEASTTTTVAFIEKLPELWMWRAQTQREYSLTEWIASKGLLFKPTFSLEGLTQKFLYFSQSFGGFSITPKNSFTEVCRVEQLLNKNNF